MPTAQVHQLSSKTACFYSIKLGKQSEKVIREACLANDQIAINFDMTPERHRQLLVLRHDEPAFLKFLNTEPARKRTYWDNQHRYFYMPHADSVWLTVDQGILYYAEDLDELNDTAFSAVSEDGWVRRKVKPWQKVPLSMNQLPGVIRNLSVQRQTIVEISKARKAYQFQLITNVLNQEKPQVKAYWDAYGDRADKIQDLIKQLDPYHFETLIDLILYRMAYSRESVLGEQEKAFDGIYQDLRNGSDKLYVQVKCSAGNKDLVEFIENFSGLGNDEIQVNGLFAFHTARNLSEHRGEEIGQLQIWDGAKIADYVIRLGLEAWLLDRVYA